MPFDNEMVVLTISPEKTRELFDYIASRTAGVPVSGIKMGIKDRKVDFVSIQGEPFDTSRPYKVLTSDYLATAGDHMSFFLDPIHVELLGLRIRDAIILHLKEQNERGLTISSQLDGRLIYTQ
jgi:2',3'-cyclic-nucleotide 2'-phosphodiesterase (5'-nucleotidase family)